MKTDKSGSSNVTPLISMYLSLSAFGWANINFKIPLQIFSRFKMGERKLIISDSLVTCPPIRSNHRLPLQSLCQTHYGLEKLLLLP